MNNETIEQLNHCSIESFKILASYLCFSSLSPVFSYPQLVFFDALEYFDRLSNPNFPVALSSGHPPFHAGYVFLSWPVFQLTGKLGLNPILATEILTVFLGLGTIIFFYLLIKDLFNKKIAFWAGLFATLVPLFWIANVSIMVETSAIFFFGLSLYLFVLFAKSGKRLWATSSAASFGYAFFTHTIIILWLPSFLAIYLLVKPKRFNLYSAVPMDIGTKKMDDQPAQGGRGGRHFLANFLFWLFFFYLLILLLYQRSEPITVSKLFIIPFGQPGAHFASSFSFNFLLRAARNWLILLLRSNTNLLVILFFINLLLLFVKKNWRLFFVLLIWISPSVLTNQLWDSVLFGRHGILAFFPISLSAALLLRQNWSKTLLTIYLLTASLGALTLLHQPIPYLELAKATAKLPDKGLLLETHFSRPQINFKGKTIIVNEPCWPGNQLEEIINNALSQGQPVFATSQALSDPYGLYTGPYLAPLSLNRQGIPELARIYNKYSFEKIITVDSQKKLFIYQIKPQTSADFFYQDFKIPYFSRERIDFYDPLTQVWFLLVKLVS